MLNKCSPDFVNKQMEADIYLLHYAFVYTSSSNP